MEAKDMKLDAIPIEYRYIVLAVQELTAEIRAFREAWQASPHQDLGAIMLANLKAQMSGGILPATGPLIKPGH
jgi:hypothetical protein